MSNHPLVITYTGNGKGKTTAALGILFRSLGHHKRCAVLQFIKNGNLVTGERKMAEQSDVLWESHGVGFTWEHDRESNTAAS
ncbi:MAG: cob(I)yrinic acid a,c-diamide adenosyltransferase, partial [Sphaerochaetaceae bacterium]|nr:cob(I)yrinic acid a,c-diamide adenosyltransferase [Sphaerochaetaceae bacterium]